MVWNLKVKDFAIYGKKIAVLVFGYVCVICALCCAGYILL